LPLFEAAPEKLVSRHLNPQNECNTERTSLPPLAQPYDNAVSALDTAPSTVSTPPIKDFNKVHLLRTLAGPVRDEVSVIGYQSLTGKLVTGTGTCSRPQRAEFILEAGMLTAKG
jgi:hypothetical protein